MLEIRRKTNNSDIPDISDLLPEIQSTCLAQLKQQVTSRHYKSSASRLTQLLELVAERYGMSTYGNGWNSVIDLLDDHYENWRGYPNPVVKGRAIAA